MDVRRLQEVSIDPSTQRVRVGAGVKWERVVPRLSEHGLAALHGSSPDVGIAGYSLGGGMGWLARKHGLQANSVTAIELVTADGVHRRVDATHEPDLFWALRGGNGNYGVVTAIEFRVFPVEELYAGAMFFPFERTGDVLARSPSCHPTRRRSSWRGPRCCSSRTCPSCRNPSGAARSPCSWAPTLARSPRGASCCAGSATWARPWTRSRWCRPSS